MQRDMDLVREILETLEQNDSGYPVQINELGIEGHSNDIIYGHLLLLKDAGYIEGRDGSTISGSEFYTERLTWAGHEFLELTQKSVWSRAKKLITDNGIGLSVTLLEIIAKEYAKSLLS